MDPNASLDRMRDAIRAIDSIESLAAPRVDDDAWTAEAEVVIEMARALDQWMSMGGFLPSDWESGRKA